MNALSERERTVLRLASQGLTDSQICVELGIAAGTLATYWKRIRLKTKLTTRPELTAAYERYRFESVLVRMAETVAEIVEGPEPDVLGSSASFFHLPLAAIVTDTTGAVLAVNKLAVGILGDNLKARTCVFDVIGQPEQSMVRAVLEDKEPWTGHLCFHTRSPMHMGLVECHWILKQIPQRSGVYLFLVSCPYENRQDRKC